LTENLSGLLFDATTFDMKGSVTGTFQGNEGNGGNLHTFDLALTEFPGSWTFTDVRVSDGRTDISSGTYTPAVSAIPEPSSWIMLSLGVLALAYGKRTRKRAGHKVLPSGFTFYSSVWPRFVLLILPCQE
jgi:hypothetical protein